MLSYGNLNIEMFLFDSCNFALRLVATVLVELAETFESKVKLLSEIIASTLFVSVVPLSFVNEIESPILNSVVNLVLTPVTASVPVPISKNPDMTTFSPFVSKDVSAV